MVFGKYLENGPEFQNSFNKVISSYLSFALASDIINRLSEDMNRLKKTGLKLVIFETKF